MRVLQDEILKRVSRPRRAEVKGKEENA